MLLKDIYFGDTDAKNELHNNSRETREKFEAAFLLPDNINLDYFESGRKFLIYGLKGTGKTALLRYLDIILQRKKYRTAFVLFKSDFSEDERKEFNYQASNVVDCSELKTTSETKDFENVWKWFFFQYILDFLIRENLIIFDADNNWKSFYNCIKSVEDKNEYNKFFPKIRKGEIQISIKIIKCILEFVESSSKTVKFSKLVRVAQSYFEKLQVVSNERIYLLLDELELEFTTGKAYHRDARIIRDLIIVAERFNNLCRRLNFPIYFIVSVRLEVLTVVSSTGKEINKLVDDFGSSVSWHQSGGNEKDHPLIHIIMKRLLAAEHMEDSEENNAKLRDAYFPDKIIQNVQVERYILNNSWYRPRDIVRLLNLAKDNFPMESSFSHRVFDGIRKMYSSKSWTECLEELKAHYGDEQLKAIVHIFNGWKRDFSLQEIKNRIDECATQDPRLNVFGKENTPLLLDRLYHMGIIGNKYKQTMSTRYRFIFRGDENLFLDRNMTIHQALIPYFSL